MMYKGNQIKRERRERFKMGLHRAKWAIILLAIIALFLILHLLTDLVYSNAPLAYDCRIEDALQVYDGDTIKDCKVLIAPTSSSSIGEVWPGIIIEQGNVCVVTDLRIAGIDTPEKRASMKKRDGTPRSEKSRANEKWAAHESQVALMQLLSSNDFKFQIVDPQQGKYAGRTVGRCVVNGIDAAQYLISRGHALPYDGGTKTELDWETLDKGLMR